ncbi:MAG: RNA polymerase factor sigma-54 [Xanthomonadales bacterium]
MIGQSLQLKLSQKLALSPQLQQAIRLLQLNRIELREYIQDALDSNPLLERDESDSSQDQDSSDFNREADKGDLDREASENDFGHPEERDNADWELAGPRAEQWTQRNSFESYGMESQIADTSTDSLREHLLWQVNLSHFSPVDTGIATAIVYGLDDDGFLPDSIQDIRASLAPELLVGEDEILAVLHRVQRMEPVGVATRNAAECILVQLSALPADTRARELALRIARDFLDLVARHEYDELKRSTRANEESLLQALDLIQSLEPRPGARYDNRHDEYLIPDVYVTRADSAWRVTLNPENEPSLRLNNHYIDLLRKSGGKDAKYLRSRLQEARWLMSSLEMRNRTLLRVSQAIVDSQQDFLEQGDIAMKPLVLKDIADGVGVHESTVSRATTRKYMLTPRGLYELKYFFSSHVRTDRGGTISATSVKAHLQLLLRNEPRQSPLSDQDLSTLLRQTGVCVARRTVAKYRESLGIGSSNERRRLYKRKPTLV